jgi:hypothetical protein
MYKNTRGSLFCSNAVLSGLSIALLFFSCVLALGKDGDGPSSREEGRLGIYVGGEKIGQEDFSIERSVDAISSRSSLNFRDPGRGDQRVRIETQLTMDSGYTPKAYRLNTDIDGRKVTMAGKFVPGQATFEFEANGVSRQRGLLVGDHYIMLDTNVFHHFAFVAQLFSFEMDKTQSMEVVIPQELANGIIKVASVGIEETSVRGSRKKLHHLTADSGTLLIDLWVDDQKTLYKIALPAKGIEVIRDR